MLETAFEALVMLFSPTHIVALTGGVFMGLFFGMVPGLGGIIGLAILLPFTFSMEQSVAIALMIGMLSVISTGDTIPAVLFGIPGTVAAQATVLDGHALAKQGQAHRALGAAYLASVTGGIIGTVILLLSIPILRPIVFAFGSPEFFMMGLLGISMVASLSSGSVLRGMLAAGLGMLLSMVGTAIQSPIPRWTFGSLYLLDGIPLIPLTLGLFAVPEMMELFIRGTSIASGSTAVKVQRMWTTLTEAYRDVRRHWFLVLRCSVLGTWVGAVPGLGSAVVDWMAYGHAATTERGARETFGKGDIRGVLAPESANNSKNGGELIPTLAFGLPGSASMAIFLGALIQNNIAPGRDMLTIHLNLTMLMVLSIVVANILGAFILLLLANQVARLASLPAHAVIPVIFVLVVVAAFESSRQFADVVVFLVFAVLGWMMKWTGWPRPPLIIAFVLGPILENYLFIATRRWGWEWLSRPMVIALAVIIVANFVYGLMVEIRGGRKVGAPPPGVSRAS